MDDPACGNDQAGFAEAMAQLAEMRTLCMRWLRASVGDQEGGPARWRTPAHRRRALRWLQGQALRCMNAYVGHVGEDTAQRFAVARGGRGRGRRPGFVVRRLRVAQGEGGGAGLAGVRLGWLSLAGLRDWLAPYAMVTAWTSVASGGRPVLRPRTQPLADWWRMHAGHARYDGVAMREPEQRVPGELSLWHGHAVPTRLPGGRAQWTAEALLRAVWPLVGRVLGWGLRAWGQAEVEAEGDAQLAVCYALWWMARKAQQPLRPMASVPVFCGGGDESNEDLAVPWRVMGAALEPGGHWHEAGWPGALVARPPPGAATLVLVRDDAACGGCGERAAPAAVRRAVADALVQGAGHRGTVLCVRHGAASMRRLGLLGGPLGPVYHLEERHQQDDDVVASAAAAKVDPVMWMLFLRSLRLDGGGAQEPEHEEDKKEQSPWSQLRLRLVRRRTQEETEEEAGDGGAAAVVAEFGLEPGAQFDDGRWPRLNGAAAQPPSAADAGPEGESIAWHPDDAVARWWAECLRVGTGGDGAACLALPWGQGMGRPALWTAFGQWSPETAPAASPGAAGPTWFWRRVRQLCGGGGGGGGPALARWQGRAGNGRGRINGIRLPSLARARACFARLMRTSVGADAAAAARHGPSQHMELEVVMVVRHANGTRSVLPLVARGSPG